MLDVCFPYTWIHTCLLPPTFCIWLCNPVTYSLSVPLPRVFQGENTGVGCCFSTGDLFWPKDWTVDLLWLLHCRWTSLAAEPREIAIPGSHDSHMFNLLKNCCGCFLKVAIPFAPPSSVWGFQFPPQPANTSICLFDYRYSDGYEEVSHYALIYTFWLNNDIKHLSVWLLGHVYFLKRNV